MLLFTVITHSCVMARGSLTLKSIPHKTDSEDNPLWKDLTTFLSTGIVVRPLGETVARVRSLRFPAPRPLSKITLHFKILALDLAFITFTFRSF